MKTRAFSPARGDLLTELRQARELAAGSRLIGAVAQPVAGVIADLLEAHQEGQDHPAPLNSIRHRRQIALQLVYAALIQGRLALAQSAPGRHLDFVGLIGDDAAIGLQPAQQIRPGQRPQRPEIDGFSILQALDIAPEGLRAAEQAGVEEDTPAYRGMTAGGCRWP